MMRSWLPLSLLPLWLGISSARAWASREGTEHPGTWLNWLFSVKIAGHRLVSDQAGLAFAWALVVAAALAGFSLLMTRRLAVRASRRQLALEAVVGGIRALLETVLGERAAQFLPFVGSLFVYIAAMNLIGLVPGFISPTSNINITAALAIVSFAAIHSTGFRERRLGYLKHFVEGVPLRFSLRVTAILTFLAAIPVAALVMVSHLANTIFLPVTLAMRLYGNIMGEEKVIESLTGMVAHSSGRWLPIQLPNMLLGVVTSLVQALIFAMLTAVNLSLVVHRQSETEGAEAA